MSSTYSALCLSHDPAITAAYDCGSPEKAAAAIAEGVEDHEHCDLLIGRYSSSLVEAGCPASRDQPANLRCCHGGTVWADADVLRLLAAAYQSQDEAVRAATKRFESRCWSPERLRKLRRELGIDEPPPCAHPIRDRNGLGVIYCTSCLAALDEPAAAKPNRGGCREDRP